MTTPIARTAQRLEGLAMLITATVAFLYCGMNWRVYALLFLAPDLSMIGYAAGPRFGALAYNLAHSYFAPLLLIAIGLTGPFAACGYGVIWCAHIGFDRALGYGLKSPEGFRFTHLGKIGRDRPAV